MRSFEGDIIRNLFSNNFTLNFFLKQVKTKKNREGMKLLYFAYLQNTPGSKKALEECLKEVELRGGSRKANQKKRKLNRAENEKVENSKAESAPNQADETQTVTGVARLLGWGGSK